MLEGKLGPSYLEDLVTVQQLDLETKQPKVDPDPSVLFFMALP